MVETKRAMTAEQLARLPSGRGERYELIHGELRTMTAAGFLHGQVVSEAHGIIWSFIKPRKLGGLVGAETGFKLERHPDHVRAPDIGFVARERLPALRQRSGFLELAPDFAVEVVSPNDTWSELREKVADWLAHGTKVVWVLDPPTRTAEIWRTDGRIDRRAGDDEMDAEPVLPGFRCRVSELFPVDLAEGARPPQ
jgi:Uma2 family endonuclease